ncbi:MAG: hypothetical protein BAJALOKI1v1_150004 [Promethearchaeota archaeon]|nr:MAG: hypothetical protein BAJALOKI1v1_150004 [Candidatus Lokiarchaeota archaeon]
MNNFGPRAGKVFRINKYITLKLENEQTNIYIDGQSFITCKYLLLNIPEDRLDEANTIKSIDEAEEKLSHDLHFQFARNKEIAPEIEFWGHCSNLHAWVENKYNTRLLHRNIAFPLLRKLTDLGDPIAKRVFKDEIAERFSTGVFSVMNYLMEGEYLSYLSEQEFETIIQSNQTSRFMMNLGKCYKYDWKNQKALDAFKQAIRLDSQNYQCWYELGFYYLEKEEYSKAIPLFKRVLRMNPTLLSAALNLADALNEIHEGQKALEILNKIIAKYPKEIRALYLLCEIYETQQQFRKCIEVLRKILTISPHDSKYRLKLGEIYFSMRNYKDAISVFTPIYIESKESKEYPQLIMSTIFLTICYLSLRDYGRVYYFYKSHYRFFNELNWEFDWTNPSIVEQKHNHLIGDVYYLLGDLYKRGNTFYKGNTYYDLKKQVDFYKQAAKHNPKYIETLSSLEYRESDLLRKHNIGKLDIYEPYPIYPEVEELEDEVEEYEYDYLVKDSKTRRRMIQKTKEKRKK